MSGSHQFFLLTSKQNPEQVCILHYFTSQSSTDPDKCDESYWSPWFSDLAKPNRQAQLNFKKKPTIEVPSAAI
jgi:hypothetical protein